MINALHTTRGRVRCSTSCVLIMISTACAGPLTREEQITVERYLVCFECPAPLKAVQLLADLKPEATVDSLNSALRLGPHTQHLADELRSLRIGHARDSAWRAKNAHVALPPRNAVVSQDSMRFTNGYRARGALGMGWIGTTRALGYLDAAIANGQLPPSVLAAARFARDSTPQPTGPQRTGPQPTGPQPTGPQPTGPRPP